MKVTTVINDENSWISDDMPVGNEWMIGGGSSNILPDGSGINNGFTGV